MDAKLCATEFQVVCKDLLQYLKNFNFHDADKAACTSLGRQFLQLHESIDGEHICLGILHDMDRNYFTSK